MNTLSSVVPSMLASRRASARGFVPLCSLASSLTRAALPGLVLLATLAVAVPARALSLAELENDPKMTPKRYANLFEDFEYEFFSYVQPIDVFLKNRRGDCDDYALLADKILRPRNYTTRLIRVVLTGRRISHVVCYVDESRAYLDYNSRQYFINLERSSPRLRDVADRVAASFQATWSSVSEFTYDYADDKKRIKYTVVKTEPPENDPDNPARRK